MATPRDFPYFWATWLPPLLVGDRSCEWAVWFKAHYQDFDRRPSDFDLAEWQRRHTALLVRTTEWWEEHGAEVRLEQQNAFRLRGETAVLAGRPDLVAIREQRIDVIDVKTGEPRPWHYQQMLLYMYALRISLDVPFGVHLGGEIVYPDKTVKVGPGAVHQGFVRDLGELIRRLASDRPARKVPSGPECRFCDIGLQDCPDRVDAGTGPEDTETDDF